jgi:hypothetical protein
LEALTAAVNANKRVPSLQFSKASATAVVDVLSRLSIKAEDTPWSGPEVDVAAFDWNGRSESQATPGLVQWLQNTLAHDKFNFGDFRTLGLSLHVPGLPNTRAGSGVSDGLVPHSPRAAPCIRLAIQYAAAIFSRTSPNSTLAFVATGMIVEFKQTAALSKVEPQAMLQLVAVHRHLRRAVPVVATDGCTGVRVWNTRRR